MFGNNRNRGYNKLKDTGSRGRKSVASRNTDHRFLVFKNADDWMKYQERLETQMRLTL
jgi:hypothetical protein